jgi:hypothetical protein
MSSRQEFALSVEAASYDPKYAAQPDLSAQPGGTPCFRVRHGADPDDYTDYTEEGLDDLAENNPELYARAVWSAGGAALHTSGRRGNCPKMPESMVS